MKRLVEFFIDRRVMAIIGLIALGILIWFGGPHLRFGGEGDSFAPLESVNARLIAIIILVVIWGLNNLRVQFQNQKKTNSLLNDVKNSQPAINPDDSKATEEVGVLGDRFADAMDILKKTQFGGKGVNKALYEIPWYIIVGPPGSGKTTALINSGLEFPLADKMGKNALGGVGGTRNCDWWFTNDAVLIDTAGRYTTQDSHRTVDSKAWQGFLDLLVRYRKRRPINGVLVAISIQDMMLQTDEERAHHARTIRARIDELVDHLGIRFPIYVIFTKVDLVAGFAEFFEDFGLGDREQVWGMTFPALESSEKGLDVDLFSREYQTLIKRLNDRVLAKVHQERDPKRRAAIFSFPQQMESLQNAVTDFLKQTFAPNRFQDEPYLRGVYFSSATQEGTPIDRLMSAVAANFGFNRDAVSLPAEKGKAFFIHRLFKQVVFPESELAGANKQYERLLRWGRRGAFAGLAMIGVVMIGIWTASFSRNQTFMNDVASHTNAFKQANAKINDWDRLPSDVLPALEELRQATLVYEKEDHPWLVGLGLYDSRIDGEAKQAYEKQLRVLLLPRLITRLESRLKDISSPKDPMLHDTLLVYTTFSIPERLEQEKETVVNWMLADWADIYRGRDDIQDHLAVHLNELMKSHSDNPIPAVELNPQLLAHGRDLLRRLPVADRIYARIKNDPTNTRSVDLSEMLGDSARTVFDSSSYSKAVSMPYLFTKDGYDKVADFENSPLIKDMFNNRWVMGDVDTEAYNDEELSKISSKVKELYLADYSDQWHRFLNQLTLVSFSDLEQARRVLAMLTDPAYSPLLSVLKVTKQNTSLTPEIPIEEIGKYAKAAKSVTGFFNSTSKTSRAVDAADDLGIEAPEAFSGNIVDQRFREINTLVKDRKNAPIKAQAILDSLKAVESYVNDVIHAPDSEEAAFNAAKARIGGATGDAIRTLRVESDRLPEPIRTWMLQISDDTWRLLLGAAKSHLNRAWRNQVYRFYENSLLGRYPLNRQSRDELALFDFSEFFKVGGVHDKFVQTFLAPFLDIQTDWSVRKLDGRGLAFSSDALGQIRNAREIKDMFFRDNPAAAGISFKLKPVKLDSDFRQVELDLGGERLVYSHGPKIPKEISWPGDGSTRVRVVFEYLNGTTRRQNFEGPWALFRLLDQSHLRLTRSSNIYRVTLADQGNNAEYEITAKSSKNPFRSNALWNYRCPERL